MIKPPNCGNSGGVLREGKPTGKRKKGKHKNAAKSHKKHLGAVKQRRGGKERFRKNLLNTTLGGVLD